MHPTSSQQDRLASSIAAEREAGRREGATDAAQGDASSLRAVRVELERARGALAKRDARVAELRKSLVEEVRNVKSLAEQKDAVARREKVRTTRTTPSQDSHPTFYPPHHRRCSVPSLTSCAVWWSRPHA